MQILFRASHHRRDDDSLKFVPLPTDAADALGRRRRKTCARTCVSIRGIE